MSPEILKTQNRPQVGFVLFWKSHIFPKVGCGRSKLLSHTVRRNVKLFLSMQVYTWTEFPLLICGIWLLKCCILLPTNLRNPKQMCRETCCMTQHNDPELCTVDYVSFSVKSSHFGAILYIFEDNEAVIKMIIKGRSPTLRHVSRTYRVAFDWLLDTINLDPKIQIKYY